MKNEMSNDDVMTTIIASRQPAGRKPQDGMKTERKHYFSTITVRRDRLSSVYHSHISENVIVVSYQQQMTNRTKKIIRNTEKTFQ
jgi:hypothetical protein